MTLKLYYDDPKDGLTPAERDHIIGEQCVYCGFRDHHGADPDHPEQFKCKNCGCVWVIRTVPKAYAILKGLIS